MATVAGQRDDERATAARGIVGQGGGTATAACRIDGYRCWEDQRRPARRKNGDGAARINGNRDRQAAAAANSGARELLGFQPGQSRSVVLPLN